MRGGRWVLVAMLLGVAICGIAAGLIASAPAGYWLDWSPATCTTTGCFCERVDTSAGVRQPINTWSSLAFVFPGCLALLWPRGVSAGNSRMSFAYRALFGVSLVVTGIGSAFYHASISFLGQFADVFGMYMLSVFMFVYAIERLRRWPQQRSLLVYMLVMVVLSAALVLIPDTRRYVFAVVLIAAVPLEYLASRRRTDPNRYRFLSMGLASMALAYVIWILDNSRVLCDPGSWLQGHALWHLLGAIATYLLYRHYVAEEVAHVGAEPVDS